MKKTTIYFLLLCLILQAFPAFSQDFILNQDSLLTRDTLEQIDTTKKILIRKIIIDGNKKTKDYIIRRELTIKEGQLVEPTKLDSLILANRLQVFNLKIFNEVNFNILNWNDEGLDLVMKIYEKWTIIPVPLVKFADRNVNEWWKQRNHDFKRLQYGLTVNWANFSGRNDLFRLSFSFGFAQMLEHTYILPQLSKKLDKLGLATFTSLSRSRRIAYNTVFDELQYLELSDVYHNISVRFDPTIIYRPRIRETHYFETGYGFTKISDSVRITNPGYFTNDRNNQHYFKVGYTFEADYRNIEAYATDGWLIRLGFTNYGLGFLKDVRMTTLFARFSKYNMWKKHPKWSLAHYGKIQLSFPDKQPYNLQVHKSLGYKENLVRGYELYVLDGQHSLVFKSEQRFRVWEFRLKNIKKLKGKGIMQRSLAYLPLTFMLKTYFDAGYVWDNQFLENNTLKNKWQFGFGAGLDIITFSSKVFRIEYSVNRQLEKRLYLHFEQSL